MALLTHAGDPHFKGCGVQQQLENGTWYFTCPPAVVFSSGFDSDMVLQRDATTAVYGQVVGEHGSDVAVDITVTNDATGVAYNVSATVTSGPMYSVETAVNYTATWKAYLRPAPVGGSYTIAAACSGYGCGGALPVSTIRRVTMGDVYFCSGQVWCGFCVSFSPHAVVACVVSTVALLACHSPCEGDADHLHCVTRDRETFRSYFSA